MAEGIARAMTSIDFEIHSAGTRPASEVHPLAVKAMEEISIDISASFPKHLSKVPTPFDLIVTVCSSAANECPNIPGVKTEAWNLPDPATVTGSEQDKLTAFRNTRDEIKGRIEDLFLRLSQATNASTSGQHSS